MSDSRAAEANVIDRWFAPDYLGAERLHPEIGQSYLRLRRWVGSIAFALPVLVPILPWGLCDESLRPTLSDYVHSISGGLFLALLGTVAVFLVAYKGARTAENWVGNIAGLGAAGVALMPARPDVFPGNGIGADGLCLAAGVGESARAVLSKDWAERMGTIHFASAALLFVMLAVYCLFIFTRRDIHGSDGAKLGLGKRARNRVYMGCGVLLLLAMAGIVLRMLTNLPWLEAIHVFWFEALGLVAFGTSWLYKGLALKPT